MSTETKYDVFISYSRKDYVDEATKQVIPGNVVSQIKEMFDANGISYWFDEDGIYSGDAFAPLIAKNIKSAKIFLFISSKNSNASEWTSNEIATAHAYKKKIIPFRYDDSVYNDSVIIYIARLDYIEYQSNPSKALSRLLSSIQTYLKSEKDREEKEKEAEERRLNEEKSKQEQANKLQQIREQIENLETRKYQIEQEISEQEKALSGLRNEKRIVEDKIENLRIERSHLLGYQHVDEKKKPKSEPKNPSLWKKIKGYLQTHKKVLTITISISMVVVLLIPTIGLLNRVDFSSPDGVENVLPASAMDSIEPTDTVIASISSSETTTYTVKGVSFEMVAVKGGEFTMGATSEQGSDAYSGKMPAHRVAPSDTKKGKTSEESSDADSDETPTHKVTLSGYMIGKTEVTQELWQAVMGSNPSRFKGDNLPVEQVSWNDCQEFIKKLNSLTGLNFRLLTEAEWEYAARGGNKSKGYKYSGSGDYDIGSVAWYHSNSSSKTHAVATKSANELGLYDMSGNVWEWCSDWYGDYSSGSQTNPKGPSSGSGRVCRGGSWDSYARRCRVSNRSYCNSPDFRNSDLGLRLAL